MKALVTGATGFLGGRLAGALAADGVQVRFLLRNTARAGALERAGHELDEGDALAADSLLGAGEGIEVAYYLIHSMARGAERSSGEPERQVPRNFARMAK